MQPYQKRVIDEKLELDEKARKLSEFIGNNPLFDNIAPEEQELMKEQCETMWEYSEILGKRIEGFTTKITTINNMSYVQERPDKCGVYFNFNGHTTFERWEARQILDELKKLVQYWDDQISDQPVVDPIDTIDLLQTNDAMVWAIEFVKTLKKCNWTLNDIDEGLMVGWFANAMFAQESKDRKLIDNLLEIVEKSKYKRGEICKVTGLGYCTMIEDARNYLGR